MNANPDQLTSPRLKADSSAKTYPESHKISPVGPPASRKAWFNNYDEEWVAFLAKSALKKSHPGISNVDPEALPRVWNSPHE